ncbi:MAG TPA: hypothetical protein VKB78_06260, partial [Pirellulales bacterium]|nr:hypothetical protein [Pirellulales bacterium]
HREVLRIEFEANVDDLKTRRQHQSKRCRCLARAMPSKLFVKHSSMRLSPGRRLSSMKRARWQKQIEALIGPVFESDARYGGSLMERFNDVGSEENILNFNVADDALERAAALADGRRGH